MLLMLNNNKSQGFPETEWTQRRLYVRGPRRVFYEEQRGYPIKLLSYREVEMLYGIDPIDIQNPQDNKFHFISDRMERNGKSNIPPGNLYMRAGRFYIGYPRENAVLEVRKEELAQIGIDEKLIDYQGSLSAGDGWFKIALITDYFK